MKRIILKTLTILVILCLIVGGSVEALAHESILYLHYDDCIGVDDTDGINEMWYYLGNNAAASHLSHETTTIKYCFSEYAEEDPNYTWTTDNISEEEAEEIKAAFANSMKKWNNVYFYSYDSLGNVSKHRVVNVIEVEEGEQNLTIYPHAGDAFIATCGARGNSEEIESDNGTHYHYAQWSISVYVNYFVDNGMNSTMVNIIRERTGAHELGHVLGLRDIDKDNSCCTNSVDVDHHEEILMGYGNIPGRSYEIQYKDIAGAAITRNLHTDEDHKWLNAGWQVLGTENAGTYKLICSICNGVRYVISLEPFPCYTYGSCDDNHDLSSGNMMAVASYGNEDYYKCRYCRYVASFSNLADQDYSYTYYSDDFHKVINNTTGLLYFFYEKHDMQNGNCVDCDYHIHTHVEYNSIDESTHSKACDCGISVIEDHNMQNGTCVDCGYHVHSYTHHYEYKSALQHYSYCICGDSITQRHAIKQSDGGGMTVSICEYCSAMISGPGVLDGIYTDLPHTENGSYILPNGIIVLVPEDEEAYFNGTLEFRTGEVM